MFAVNQDFTIVNGNVPVLARQENGGFQPKICHLLEFVVKKDTKTMEICKPFDFATGVQQAISMWHSSTGAHRLFLLADPDIIKNHFKDPDDFLAFALCLDEKSCTTIQYFEVNYNFRHSYEPNQKYRRVGTSAIQALQKIYRGCELCGRSTLDAYKFWTNNGFTRIDGHELHLHWQQR